MKYIRTQIPKLRNEFLENKEKVNSILLTFSKSCKIKTENGVMYLRIFF